MVEESQDKRRAKYVWDRDKLAWVAAEDTHTAEMPAQREGVSERTYEEAVEEPASEDLPVEAATEAVEEMLQYRGAWVRLAALFIDGIVIAVVNLIGRQIFGTESTIASWLIPIICAIYFIGFWTWRGQSLGKLVIGAKIVRLDGSPIDLWRAILRYLGYFLYLLIARLISGPIYTTFIIIAIGLFIIAFNRKKRGLHDFIAGTVVINSRPKPLEDYEEEEEYEGAYEGEEEIEALE